MVHRRRTDERAGRTAGRETGTSDSGAPRDRSEDELDAAVDECLRADATAAYTPVEVADRLGLLDDVGDPRRLRDAVYAVGAAHLRTVPVRAALERLRRRGRVETEVRYDGLAKRTYYRTRQ